MPSYSYFDDTPYCPVPTRSGALASLIRSRSASSLHRHPYAPPPAQPHDEEAAVGDVATTTGAEDDIARLLANEQRLSQILHGPQARSMNLIGKSNPRYRWETYWKREHELRSMPKSL